MIARKDPYRGSPHPQTLHRWWARRPLSACRAFIYAALVDDPSTDAEREELLKEVADLASWTAVRYPNKTVRSKAKGGSGLTGTELLKRARQRILDCNSGKPPKLFDPFAGGGAIPLEGLRLGCDVQASDLNPVAVLILKGTVEYPQKYGQPNSRSLPEYVRKATQITHPDNSTQNDLSTSYTRNPLATDVRYWGRWMLESAKDELAELYPSDPDGSVPVAYLWCRTIPCPNCGAKMPLIRQYWLEKKKREVALEPTLDYTKGSVGFEVVEGASIKGNPTRATISRVDARCLFCEQVVKADQVHDLGRAGLMESMPTAVVLKSAGKSGKQFRSSSLADMEIVRKADVRAKSLHSLELNGLPAIPDEPLAYHPQYMVVREYGFDQWGKLYTPRQLIALTTFARLVGEAHNQMLAGGLDADYAKCVATYLGLAISRLSSEHSTLVRWNPTGPKGQGALALQALPMVWDYAELNPWGGSVGDATNAFELVASAIEFSGNLPQAIPAHVAQRDARESVGTRLDLVITDPPYYDSINYADIADYYYVWLKRSLGSLNSDLLGLPLTPKREQIVMNVYGTAGNEPVKLDKGQARQKYVNDMAQAFSAMGKALEARGFQGVVFAHTDPEAWATLIEGLITAGLVPNSSWPIDTEIRTKFSAVTQARLKTSVWMACRKREGQATEAFFGDVMDEMRSVIRERLLYFWSKGIRGADFFISAIGPALSVFGRHSRVLHPDGSQVSVRDFLDIVRRESTTVALERVLGGADLGAIDPITRHYVTWVWSYSKAPLDTGEAIALGLATGASSEDTTGSDSITVEDRQNKKKVIRLCTIRERATKDENLGYRSSARSTALIDELQYAAWLWGENLTDRLDGYRRELGESRWTALRTLAQAVAECLPEGDEDRRLVLGILGSRVMATASTEIEPSMAGSRSPMLPGF